jgi:hypothetical protein
MRRVERNFSFIENDKDGERGSKIPTQFYDYQLIFVILAGHFTSFTLHTHSYTADTNRPDITYI